MKTNLFFLICTVLQAMFLAGCASDNDTGSSVDKLPVVKLYAGHNPTSRTTMDATDNITWSAGDVINVNGSASTNTALSNGNATAVYTVSAAAPYYAIYPNYSSGLTYNSTSHTFGITFPATQTYKSDVSFSDNVNPSVAYGATSNSTLSFYNVCGMLRVPITTNTGAVTARFVSADNPVAGAATVAISTGAGSNSTMTITGTGMTMDLTSLPSASASYTLNWVLPVGTYGAGWMIELLDASGNILAKTTATGALTIARAQITNVSSVLTMKMGIYSGGLYWAPGNLVAPTTSSYSFASAQETYVATSASGYYFCWNTLNSQATSSSNSSGSTWYTTADPCSKVAPTGTWRMPTQNEYTALINTSHVWGTKNSINGCYFGTTTVPTTNVNNYIFLPAAGGRLENSASLISGYVGNSGCYSTSSFNTSSTECELNFTNTTMNINTTGGRNFGISVRCVSQ